jgi:hypothetical protein
VNRSTLRRAVPLRRLALAVAVVIPIAAASCSVAAPSPSPSQVDPSPATTGTPRPEPTSATPAPTAIATPSPTASPVEPAGTPPAASVSAEGGDPVVGQLGSYTWGGGGSDSPWLPGTPVTVGAREPLTVTVAGDPPVSQWTARRTRAGATNQVGAIPVGSGSGPIAIDAPASGSWTLAVSVTFAGGLGSATWYWRLDVR